MTRFSLLTSRHCYTLWWIFDTPIRIDHVTLWCAADNYFRCTSELSCQRSCYLANMCKKGSSQPYQAPYWEFCTYHICGKTPFKARTDVLTEDRCLYVVCVSLTGWWWPDTVCWLGCVCERQRLWQVSRAVAAWQCDKLHNLRYVLLFCGLWFFSPFKFLNTDRVCNNY